ncbi:CheR family methyltransferase [Sulfurospirillum sp. 1307]|jgi:chemotaxis protein methyltransferase CheR
MFFFRKKKKVESDSIQKLEKEEFSTYGLNDVFHLIKRETGVDLFAKKSIIETRLKLFCEEKEIYSFKKLYDEIKYNIELKQEVINLLTVNETYFYREEKQLQVAIDFIKSLNRDVEIVCAPCASGEEVYTISMLLNEQLGNRIKFRVIGIDINSQAIEKAKIGIYTERSLHKLSDNLKYKYFTKENDKFKIKKDLFSSVDFFVTNIFDHSFFNLGKFDLIFSRNMLIYFDEEFRVKTMEQFSKIIKNDGRLYLGHADIVPENKFFTKNGYGPNCYYTLS